MLSLTKKEREALLILVKDYDTYHNANSLSKRIGISHVGAQKMLKRFKEQNLTDSKKIGKAIIHKPRLDDEYTRKLISFLLADEAQNFRRWKEEFRGLHKKDRIIMIYGSAIKDYRHAKDIDILLVIKKEESKEVNKILGEIGKFLPKRIHAIKLTETDIVKNLIEKKKAVIDIIKNAVILYGQDTYVEVMESVPRL